MMTSDLKTENYKIVIADGGGVGDALIDLILLKKIKEILPEKFLLVCGIVIADEVYSYKEWITHRDEIRNAATLVIIMHNIAIIDKIDKDIIQNASPLLYKYCIDAEDMYRVKFSRIANNYRFTKLGMLLGRNRIEQMDMHCILGISRNDTYQIKVTDHGLNFVRRQSWYHEPYITVNRDVGSDDIGSPKLWPVSYYMELMKRIKKVYPWIKILLVGAKKNTPLSDAADYDTSGITDLEETTAILNNSILHIGSEGGLVHICHFLGKKSMVFFGPTSVDVFGYSENINLYKDVCNEHCEWLIDDWTKGCVLGERAKCIRSITSEDAFLAFQLFMGEQR